MHGLALFAALFAAVIGTTSAEFNGVGCFKNSESDPVLKAKWSNELMTPEACENYCISSEMPLYGLQGGDACWCGDCYVLEDGSSKYDRHGSASCGIPCTGEPSSDCGGDNAFSLFYSDDCIATQAPVPTPSPTKLAPTSAPTESLEVTMSPTSAEGTL